MAGILCFCIGVAVGVVIGYLLCREQMKKKRIGTLRIDRSDPDDGPFMFLELSKNLEFVIKSKYVVMDVNPRDYVSQK